MIFNFLTYIIATFTNWAFKRGALFDKWLKRDMMWTYKHILRDKPCDSVNRVLLVLLVLMVCLLLHSALLRTSARPKFSGISTHIIAMFFCFMPTLNSPKINDATCIKNTLSVNFLSPNPSHFAALLQFKILCSCLKPWLWSNSGMRPNILRQSPPHFFFSQLSGRVWGARRHFQRWGRPRRGRTSSQSSSVPPRSVWAQPWQSSTASTATPMPTCSSTSLPCVMPWNWQGLSPFFPCQTHIMVTWSQHNFQI